MIYQLKGIIDNTSSGFAIIDVNGVGYGVYLPERLIGEQIKIGESATISTVTVVSQDNIQLFGFLSSVDREFFRMLLGIPRIGPKAAMKILSGSPAVKIMQSIISGDLKSLSKIQGVGPKVAQRLVIELQEKVKSLLTDEEGEENAFDEAVDVLTGLGCTPDEAGKVLSKIKKDEDMSFDDILNEALRVMSEEEICR